MTDSLDIMLRILLGADTVRNFENGTTSIEDALKGVDQEALDLADTFANQLDASLKELDKQFANTKKSIEGMKQSAEKVGQISQAMFVAGSAIVGGMYLAAKTEADRVMEAGGEIDGVTARWIVANERIEASQQKIGRAAEVAVLPLMEQAASLAEKAADFVDKHPDLVSAALKIGVVTASIGALGSVAAKGIRLFADAKYLLASTQMTIDAAAMNTAAATMFEAAVLMQIGGSAKLGYGVAGGLIGPATTVGGTAVAGGAAATAGSAALLIAAPIVGAMFAKYVGNAFQSAMGQKESSWGDIATTAKQIGSLINPISLLSGELGLLGFDDASAKVRKFNNELFGLGTSAEAAGEAEAIAAAQKKANAEDEAAAMKKMDDLTQQNAKAERKFAADREDIFTDEARAMEDANRKLSKNLTDIASSLNKDVAKIRGGLRSNLAELASNFSESNLKAEREYQTQRADIVVSGADEIKKIHQQTQKDLENAERDHSTNVAGLIANRDALGLVEEKNAYAQKQADIKKNANESIAQARANTQAQLAEAAQNYAEQRAQRLADYEAQKADAKTKAAEAIAEAQAKAAEDKKRAIAAAAEQKAEIERKRIEALADLKKAYDRERKERITAVYNEIIELRGALNAEMLMRRQYQGQILTDTTAHMKAMQTAQSQSTGGKKGTGVAILTKSSDPEHDYSGYAYTGTYAMAQDGQREFVLSGAATKAAEQMVGGQLNQQALLSGLAGQGGTGMQYVDHSSYSGMSVADVRRVRQMSRQEAISVMSEVYRK
jgi:hypothetical protein